MKSLTNSKTKTLTIQCVITLFYIVLQLPSMRKPLMLCVELSVSKSSETLKMDCSSFKSPDIKLLLTVLSLHCYLSYTYIYLEFLHFRCGNTQHLPSSK